MRAPAKTMVGTFILLLNILVNYEGKKIHVIYYSFKENFTIFSVHKTGLYFSTDLSLQKFGEENKN
jgi:hypothetical protein